MLSLLLALSLLSLQLGFSFWFSGATLGCILIAVIYTCYLKINERAGFAGQIPFLFTTFLLGIEFIAIPVQLILRDLRTGFFLILYSAFISFPFEPSSLLMARRLQRVYFRAAELISFTFIGLWVYSFIPNTILRGRPRADFLSQWLVTVINRSEFHERIILAEKFSYLTPYRRLALIYEEPSYLAVSILCVAFVLLTALAADSVLPPPSLSKGNIRRTSKEGLYLLFVLMLMLLATGSVLGSLYLIFIAIYSIFILQRYLPGALANTSLLVKSIPLLLYALLFIEISVGSSGLFGYLFSRATSILSGSDISAQSRIYPIDNLYESITSIIGLRTKVDNIKSIDFGIVKYLLKHGLLFIAYLLTLRFALSKRIPAIAWFYFFYLTLVFAQSGSIFSPDKFFLALMPMPLALAVTHLSTDSSPPLYSVNS